MRICKNCKGKVPESATFCLICGTELEKIVNKNSKKTERMGLDDDDDFFAPVNKKNKNEDKKHNKSEEKPIVFVDFYIIDESISIKDPFLSNKSSLENKSLLLNLRNC